MPQYVAGWRYHSTRDGQSFGLWLAGTVVDLSDEDAAWVNRDSHGVLTPYVEPVPDPVATQPLPPTPEPEPATAAVPEREAKPTRDRMVRGGRNRTG